MEAGPGLDARVEQEPEINTKSKSDPTRTDQERTKLQIFAQQNPTRNKM
jgi:hypothetical protein